LFLAQLRRAKPDVFPHNEKAENKYLEYIPFTWTACNNLGKPTSNTVMLDMMIISVLNYQVDHYMEATIARYHEHNLQVVKDIIVRVCEKPERITSVHQGVGKTMKDAAHLPKIDSDVSKIPSLADIEEVLARFVTFVMHHKKVVQCPRSVQERLKQELSTFLLAHVTQAEDNARFSNQLHSPQGRSCFHSPRATYFDWVRTTSADHTSCPYSFAFFGCLISKTGQEVFTTAKQKYLAQSACRHLATMCRQYNDYGSVRRDSEERNLNSVNFPEYGSIDVLSASEEERIKAELLWLAEYERECLEATLKRLRGEVEEKVMDVLRFFVTVTDLYGQIYVARDVMAYGG